MLKDDTTVSDKPPCVFYVNTTGGRGELSVIIITDYCISFKARAYSFLLVVIDNTVDILVTKTERSWLF